jgi:GntR family transcriptional regulator
MAQLEIALDRGGEMPLGAQLGWQLRSLIAAGRLAEGERLPGVREMAALAGVNVNTVRTVYGRLADEGLIVSEHGRGTFVADAEAARRGLDRMSAALGTGPAAAEPASRGTGRASAEARRRASLRAEIALLERELAALEVPANGAAEGAEGAETRARGRPAPQLLGADELEATRDALVERLRPLRADRNIARADRERSRSEPAPAEPPARQRAIARSTPRFEAGPGGGWSLRWSG